MVLGSECYTQKILFHPYYDCCETPKIVESRGIHTCRNCATVHEPTMKRSFTYNPFDHTSCTAQKSNNPYLTHGCRTTFTFTNLPPKSRHLFQRLAKLNNHFRNSSEMNMQIANKFLLTVAGQLEIPSTIQSFALHLYKKVVDARLTMGRSIKELMVACLYITCNLSHYPRHISDFVNKSLISEKKIRRAYKLLLSRFNLRLHNFSVFHYIEKYSSELALSPDSRFLIRKIVELLSSRGINMNANPRGFAIAAIYVTSKALQPLKWLRQKSLSELSKVSEVTIRKYVKIIDESLDIKMISAELHSCPSNFSEVAGLS